MKNRQFRKLIKYIGILIYRDSYYNYQVHARTN